MAVTKLQIWAFFSLFLAVGCSETPQVKFTTTPEVRIDLEEIKKRGYINALVDNNSISYFIYRGQSMGYEYELLSLFAKELGVDLKITITTGVDRAIDQLNRGEGDILAFPLTVTKDRREYLEFSKPHFLSRQVLVQRKPDAYRNMTMDEIQASLIQDPVELIGKEVYVLPGTSFERRLQNLSEEIGGDIVIRKDTSIAESESLIRKVAMGEIDYTVTDHMIANVNASYYPNIDVSLPLSVSQQVAWATRKNSPDLLAFLNDWLTKIKKEPTFMVIYNRYYKNPRTSLARLKSDYSSLGGSKLSPYDTLIKIGAQQLGWDWRLLASLVYQESNFEPTGESWAGARGLMQLMPSTAKRFGANNLDDPRQSLSAGVGYLKHLDNYWQSRVPDTQERVKFILASYNAGLTHIIDARKLTEKYGGDPAKWEDHVATYLLKKSEPKFYRDPLVQAGFCKCEEPVNYVREILERYNEYRLHIAS
jgi:membrane-bound lytic murein transglycosylase F